MGYGDVVSDDDGLHDAAEEGRDDTQASCSLCCRKRTSRTIPFSARVGGLMFSQRIDLLESRDAYSESNPSLVDASTCITGAAGWHFCEFIGPKGAKVDTGKRR